MNIDKVACRVRGDLACFTRPELKTERTSYEVMTPSAARGILEAIFWKPAIRWYIDKIAVLAPIKWMSLRCNERKDASRNSPITRRHSLLLRDVDYVIEAHCELTSYAGSRGIPEPTDKFVTMFNDRLYRGAHFHQPCLGIREYIADVSPVPPRYTPHDESRDLGIMLYDIDYETQRQVVFHAVLDRGIIEVPYIQLHQPHDSASTLQSV